MAHSSFTPAALATDSWMKACGLVHWNSLTVPLSVTRLVWSNMAKEWCAPAVAMARRPSSAAADCDLPISFFPNAVWIARPYGKYILPYQETGSGVGDAGQKGTDRGNIRRSGCGGVVGRRSGQAGRRLAARTICGARQAARLGWRMGAGPGCSRRDACAAAAEGFLPCRL